MSDSTPVRCAPNELTFSSATPIQLWSGTWSSDMYWGNLVHGDVEVELPSLAPGTKALARISYTGLYRRGHRFELPVAIGEGGPGAGAAATGTFRMAGEFGGQRITYDLKFNPGQIALEGAYESTNPVDRGTVTLHPGQLLTEVPESGGWCTLL